MVNMNPHVSDGMRVNDLLDRCGLPDSLGDQIGARIDQMRGDRTGEMINLRDLWSGLPTKDYRSQWMRQPSWTPAFGQPRPLPRPGTQIGGTQPPSPQRYYWRTEQVGTRATDKQVADIQNLNIGVPRQINDKLERRAARQIIQQSFQSPIQLKNGKWISNGLIYNTYADIQRDKAYGQQDGIARTRVAVPKPVNQYYAQPVSGGTTGTFAPTIPPGQLPPSWNVGAGGCWLPSPGWPTSMPPAAQPIWTGGSGAAINPYPGVTGGGYSSFPSGGISGGSLTDRLVSSFGPGLAQSSRDVENWMNKVSANPNDESAKFQLQLAMQRRTELVNLMTNLIKAEHDARMAIIHNLRA